MVASAAANAENNFGLDPRTLVISECYANEGPTMRRYQPRAQGRMLGQRQDHRAGPRHLAVRQRQAVHHRVQDAVAEAALRRVPVQPVAQFLVAAPVIGGRQVRAPPRQQHPRHLPGHP